MPSLEAYKRDLDYSYAPGIFPTIEALINAPGRVRRVLVSSQTGESEGLQRIEALCREHRVRIETADKALSRLSGKDNCYAAAVFSKSQADLDGKRNHLVLHHPSDAGNLGTMLRTALGFGYLDVVLIRPCTDVYHPHVVRASMGAIFSLRVREFDEFETYRSCYPDHALYPFMLKGSVPLSEAAAVPQKPFALVFGNEGSGLPDEFLEYGTPVRIPHSERIDSLNLSVAAAIGMYEMNNGGRYETLERKIQQKYQQPDG